MNKIFSYIRNFLAHSQAPFSFAIVPGELITILHRAHGSLVYRVTSHCLSFGWAICFAIHVSETRVTQTCV